MIWNQNLLRLLEDIPRPIGTPRLLPFSARALDDLLDFSEYIERNQGDGARLSHISDWTAKLPGAMARIAGLLEVAENGLSATVVTPQSTERACALCLLLIPHAEAAFRLMGAADGEGDALAVLRWIDTNHLHEFTRHDAHKAMEGRFRTVDRLKEAIRLLQEWCVLAPEQLRPNERARASAVYAVNPKLFVDKSTEAPKDK